MSNKETEIKINNLISGLKKIKQLDLEDKFQRYQAALMIKAIKLDYENLVVAIFKSDEKNEW